MEANINAIELITGLHSSRSPAFQGQRANDNTLRYLVNTLNVAGWFPLVGTISGIARLIFAAVMYRNDYVKSKGNIDPETKAFYTAMVIRGVIEMLSCGFLLIAQDIIFTVGREIAYPPIKGNQIKATPAPTAVYYPSHPPIYHTSSVYQTGKEVKFKANEHSSSWVY